MQSLLLSSSCHFHSVFSDFIISQKTVNAVATVNMYIWIFFVVSVYLKSFSFFSNRVPLLIILSTTVLIFWSYKS